MSETAWEALGGEAGVTRLIEQLVERAAADIMIGFFFSKVDLEQVKRHELELAAAHLGGPAGYTGRPLHVAHAAHPIAMGHFHRRLKILEEVLDQAGAPSWARDQWLEHDRRQAAAVVRGECNEGA